MLKRVVLAFALLAGLSGATLVAAGLSAAPAAADCAAHTS